MKEPLKPRDKITQRMTRDGLVQENQTTGQEQNVSGREAEQKLTSDAQDAAPVHAGGTVLMLIDLSAGELVALHCR